MSEKLTELELKLKKIALAGKKYADDLIDAASIHIYVKATANEGFLKTYIVSTAKSLAEVTAQNTIGEIDIPKDFLVKSGTVETVETANAPYEGAKVGDKYIDLVINSKGDDATAQHLYIPAKDLVDIYTSGDGINVGSDNVISIKLNATASGLELDANGLKIKVAATGANGLSIDSDGLKLALAQASTNGVGGSAGAMSATDKEKLDKALTSDDIANLSNAEIGSWYGYDATESDTILGSVSDDVVSGE